VKSSTDGGDPKPLVSIIMPCYNGETYIAEAIKSVLGQTVRDFELIVVDDGSTDQSPCVLERYRGRIRVVRQRNRGVSTARNVGIEQSRGEFIAFLDADDYWAPEFLQEMVKGMEDPQTAIAYCGWQTVGAVSSKPFVPPDYETADKMHHLLRFASLWPIHAILIRRSSMPEGLSFNPEYPACEDYDLWLRIASFHRIQLVPRVLAFYRRHSTDQATTDQARVARYNLLVKQRFLSEFPALKRRISKTQLRAYYAGGVVNRGYRCFWKGDLANAHAIFRHALIKGLVGPKDLKYAIPSLLPYSLYAQLVRGRSLLT
jgi:glycosyltransferase involved in cell wall biosynthesis